MAALYAPQPILPRLAAAYGVSLTEAAALITWALLPMAIAPLAAGVLLQRVAPSRLVAMCSAGLGLAELACAVAPPFGVLVALRLAQGVCIGLLLPSVMTYIALACGGADAVRRAMGWYVASAVVGGLVGRLLAGYLAEVAPWGASFAILGALLLAAAVATARLERVGSGGKRVVRMGELVAVLRTPVYSLLFGVVFAAFFVFTALLNFAPFRIAALTAETGGGSGQIALAYLGFVAGIATSIGAARIARSVGGALRAVGLGVLTLSASVVLLLSTTLPLVTAAIALSAGGFFLVHAVLSGHINTLGQRDPEAVNGAYVTLYYLGGALGSVLPGFLYESAGWAALVYALLAVMGLSLGLLLIAGRAERAVLVVPH